MTYRTKAYIAGDWDKDRDLIDQLRKWNDSSYWSLSFSEAHNLASARDTSLNCSIKESLRKRLDASKIFILVVGDKTSSVTAGSCRWCDSYSSFHTRCFRGRYVDFRSFIDYECEYAAKNNLRVVVLYNYASVHKDRCPKVLRHLGTHIPAFYQTASGEFRWHYQAIKVAIEG